MFFPTFVASNLTRPSRLRVAPITSWPGVFHTGMDSPVIMDSSKAELPSQISPSTGTFSPGRTTTVSPTSTSSTGISTSAPCRTTRAVLACRFINAFNASDVLLLARVSRYFPRRINVMMAAPVSK